MFLSEGTTRSFIYILLAFLMVSSLHFPRYWIISPYICP